jgi:hypothetical protein
VALEYLESYPQLRSYVKRSDLLVNTYETIKRRVKPSA